MSDPVIGFPEPGLGSSLSKLLRLRLSIIFNSFRRAKARTRMAYIGAGLGLLAFVFFLLATSTALLGFLRSPLFAQYLGNVTPFLECLPSMVMTIAGIGILLTSFGVLLQTLYLSGDMDFLMSAPLPVRAVFTAKMIQAILPNFLLLCLVALPTLFGLGISSGYSLAYYPCVILVLTCIVLSAASIASLLVLVVVRFFRPRRVSEVIGFVLGIVIFVSSQSVRFVNLDFADMNEQRAGAVAQFLERTNTSWSPLAWAGRGLVHIGKGEWLSGSGLLAVPLILSGILFLAAIVTSERLYHTGWAGLQAKKTKAKSKSPSAAGTAVSRRTNFLFGSIPAPVRAIVAKDLRLCIRDLSNVTALLFPMILGIIYAYGLVHSHFKMPAGHGKAPAGFMQAGNSVFLYGDIALALFLGWTLVSNLAGLAFTREGRNYWMLKAAPISARRLLAAKFLVSFIPSAAICSIYILALQLLKRVDVFSIAISLVTVWILVAGLSGIYLAFGAQGAKFDWENPAQRNRSVGCLAMLAGMIFLPFCFALFIGPAIIAHVFHFPEMLGRLAGLLLGGIANTLAVVIPLALVEKRVSILNENR